MPRYPSRYEMCIMRKFGRYSLAVCLVIVISVHVAFGDNYSKTEIQSLISQLPRIADSLHIATHALWKKIRLQDSSFDQEFLRKVGLLDINSGTVLENRDKSAGESHGAGDEYWSGQYFSSGTNGFVSAVCRFQNWTVIGGGFTVVDGVNLSGLDWHLVTLPQVLDTLWHQVALVWRQGNSLTMYLDGDSAQSMVLPDVPLFHASWICCSFGAFKPCDLPSDHRFRGSVDEAKVWNRALSPEEVAVGYHRVLLGTIGDFDNNGILSISDAVAAVNYVFSNGTPPDPLIRGDADCNGIITISDAVYMIQYIFTGGPPPCEV